MQVVKSSRELQSLLRSYQEQGVQIGFVPTMGALHEGHLSLIRCSKAENAVTVASIFVNPTQFGPGEDFDRYPRDLARDSQMLSSEKVDFLFVPDVREIYPEHSSTFIEETSLSQVLCGAHRPGHFRGVLTVVFRFFHIIEPENAYFGEKDAQQLRVIQKMVKDLDLKIEIVPCPTVREPDGLAMSSRNAYLSEEERKAAPLIYQALHAGRARVVAGERKARELLEEVKTLLLKINGFELQYLELRRWEDFAEISELKEKALLAVAGNFRKTRLIDNVILLPS